MHLVLVLGLAAASSFAAVTEADADNLFRKQDWRQAAGAYRQLTAEAPSRASHWFRLGISLQALRQPEEALAAFTKARSLHFKPTGLYIRAAILLTETRQYDRAIEWLQELTTTGFAPSALEGIAPLAALRQTEAYKAFRASKAPLCSGPEYRALDFWTGSFEVRNPQGQITGHNRIDKILNGCALEEHWTSQGGGAGRSFTWFDPDLKKWRQTFIGSTGHSHDYTGEFRDGAMHFLHDRTLPDGSRHMLRMTFTPKDNANVHQFIEESWDGGKSWAVWFDGMYFPSTKKD